ncbi:MAG: sugar phosphate isomerase/epimerase [Bryobacteraceae bacterium]|nr:sugar phosphate isomerase/epimerase [Bryobacteraceae bacterium]
MFWAGRDSLEGVRRIGFRCGQLGIEEDVSLPGLQYEFGDFALATVFCAYEGEDYADFATVERTVGFIPRAFRARRVERTLQVSDWAAQFGVSSIACHIGVVPEDPRHPDFAGVLDAVRLVCDRAASNGQTFALETGQERADVLLEFLREADRDNLKINFDPANLILYGTDDPLEAIGKLAPHVVSVHMKDGDPPEPGAAGTLGRERPLGSGSVDIATFFERLQDAGYRGILAIERESRDPEERWRDIAQARALLLALKTGRPAPMG